MSLAVTFTNGGSKPASGEMQSTLSRLWATLKNKRQQFAIYNRTYNELAALSNRELADLGIPRSHIRRLALESMNSEHQS
ncbi:MAG: DUF1127 domain-containing protein [Sulfitobacter sp.]